MAMHLEKFKLNPSKELMGLNEGFSEVGDIETMDDES